MPTAVAVPTTNQLISGFDLHKPEKLARLIRRYGDQGASFFAMLKIMGFDMPVAQEEYSHFEENRFHDVLTVDAPVGAPGAGNDISFVLNSVSLDAFNNFYARGWDTIMFPNEVTGQIVNINTATPSAPVITVRPNQLTDAIPALTAGQELIIISNAFSEGSVNPVSAISGTTEFTNYIQKIKETFTVTGTEMTNQSWLQIKGMPDAPYYLEGQMQSDYRFALRAGGALLFQKPTTNTAMIDPDTGRPVQTTEGLIPAMRRRGNPIVSTPGTWSVADYSNLTRIATREGAGPNYLAMMGLNKLQENRDVMKAYFADTNIVFAKQAVTDTVFRGNGELEAILDFKYLTVDGFNFMFQKVAEFSDPKLYGANGYSTPNYAVFMPVNKMKDPKSGKFTDTLGMRYKKWGSTNRMLEVWNGDSGAGPIKVTSRDVQNTYWRGDIGAHQMALNQSMLVSPQ